MATILAALGIDASYLAACFLVLFYAWTRFNTPRTNRSQTSQFQYMTSSVTYMLSSLGLLMLLAWALAQNPALLGFLHTGSPAPLSDDLKSLDAALVAALVLTTLLPSFPVLREFDAKLLKFFHRMGAIPFGAVRWAQRLEAAPFTIAPGPLEDARNYIRSSALLPDSLVDQLQPDFSASPRRFRFSRNLVLYVALRNLPSRARFADDFPDDIALFERKLSRYFAQCVTFFSLSGSAQPGPADELRQLGLEAYEDIRLMLARMILYSCNGENEVTQKLADLGFALERPAPIRMPVNLLSLDFIGVVVLFAVSTLLPSQAPVSPLSPVFAIGVLVAVNHGIAATFAILPKQVWSFADIRCAGERPVLAYVLSGAGALTTGLLVSYAFYLIRVHVLPAGPPILPFPAQCKWLLLPTVLAVGLAFACDDAAGRTREPEWLRWAEGLAVGCLLATAGLLAMHWLQPDRIALHPDGNLPPMWKPVLLSASIGALFGATIPFWYRNTLRRSVGAAPPASPAVPNLAGMVAGE